MLMEKLSKSASSPAASFGSETGCRSEATHCSLEKGSAANWRTGHSGSFPLVLLSSFSAREAETYSQGISTVSSAKSST